MYIVKISGVSAYVTDDLADANDFIDEEISNSCRELCEYEIKEDLYVDYDTEIMKRNYLMAKIELMMDKGVSVHKLQLAKNELLILENKIRLLKPKEKGKIR